MINAFIKLIRRTHAFLALTGDYESGRLSHAYLLDAPDRMAGKLCMEQFAGTVLGAAAAVDAYRIPAPDAGTVLAGDIDGLIADLPKRPSMGDHKLYLIDCAETMSAQCQNKLLKTLEEPQNGVTLILNSKNVHKMLPTILSRCRRLEIRPFVPRELADALAEEYGGQEKAKVAAALSGGDLGEAVSVMQDGKKLDRFRLSLDILASTRSSKDVLLSVSRLASLKEKAYLSEIINYFELILRDVAAILSGQKQVMFLNGYETEIITLSTLYSRPAVLKILPFLNKIRKRLHLNANQNSLLDELIFTVARIRAGG